MPYFPCLAKAFTWVEVLRTGAKFDESLELVSVGPALRDLAEPMPEQQLASLTPEAQITQQVSLECCWSCVSPQIEPTFLSEQPSPM
ncbi:hypothetical protein MATL_G00229310 [Megalops atlanticus]|uniref:Uncharacterized protein n=1 Tax=Megalops atlanticus TaxID=7932 RepID=A0A9D3SVL1_MEGAT|nr:hypothetical protein MATL_G00229310 [Megalops atlanticus]